MPQVAFSRPASSSDGLVRLVGIARMAAESSVLVEKRRVEYRNLATRKWLNRCQSERVPFDWTINPYRGCEFGCKYCYARYTHDFLERHDPAAFETEIYAKEWNAADFQEELKIGQSRPDYRRSARLPTPISRPKGAFSARRTCWKQCLTLRGVSIFLTTKSNLVSRDAALFLALAKHNRVHVTRHDYNHEPAAWPV